MMMMKSVIWWRKPEYPEETTDLRQVARVSCMINPMKAAQRSDPFKHSVNQALIQNFLIGGGGGGVGHSKGCVCLCIPPPMGIFGNGGGSCTNGGG